MQSMKGAAGCKAESARRRPPGSRQVLSWAALRYKDQSAEGVWKSGLHVSEALERDVFVEIFPTDHIKYKLVDGEKHSIVCSLTEEERTL